MKRQFSTKWISSKQPRKQRKYRAKAPLHIKQNFLSCNLSKDLRIKHERRNIPLRKDDKVKIMRGKFKGKQGKILEVNVKKSKVKVEGIQIKKMDGSKVNIWLQPSNLQIVELNLEDIKRSKRLRKEVDNKEKKSEIEDKKSDKKQERKTKVKIERPKNQSQDVNTDKEKK